MFNSPVGCLVLFPSLHFYFQAACGELPGFHLCSVFEVKYLPSSKAVLCKLVVGLCVAFKKKTKLFTFLLEIHVVAGSFSSVTFPTHVAFMKHGILCTLLH